MNDEQDPHRRLYEFLDLLAASQALLPVSHGRSGRIFSKDDPASSLFLLRSGRLKISKPGIGRRETIFRIVEPGQVFGEEGFPGGGSRGVGAKALEQVVVTEVPRAVILEGAKDEPKVFLWLADLIDCRRRQALRRIDLLSLRNVQHRLILFLRDLAGNGRSPDGVLLRLRQGDLAGLIGATRETTSVNLNALARQGLIDIGRCNVRVTSFAALLEAATEIEKRLRGNHPPEPEPGPEPCEVAAGS